MTRSILIIFILTLLSSCAKVGKKDYVEEFVLFGTSGFCFRNSAENQIWDSTKLDIREYFEYKKDSFIRIARRRPLHLTEYYSIGERDTIGLDSLMNRVLLFQTYKKEYELKDPEIYDGWEYILYYKTSNQKEYIVNYVPHHLPINLRVLHDFITKIIDTANPSVSSKFEYNGITRKEAKELYSKYPPPPPKQTLQRIKFIAPANKDLTKK